MIFGAIVASGVLLPKHIDKVELRRVGGRPRPPFYLQATTSSPKTVFLNGTSAGVVMPGYYAVEIDGHNELGRVIGRFYADPFWDKHPIGFATRSQGVHLLPFLPSHIDRSGRVVGTSSPYLGMPASEDPYNPNILPHAWLMQKGKSTDLGLGHDVRFAKDGSIQGFVVCDEAGKPVNELSGKMLYGKLLQLRFRWFSYKNGRRKNDQVLRTSVPFKDKDYSGWLDPDPNLG